MNLPSKDTELVTITKSRSVGMSTEQADLFLPEIRKSAQISRDGLYRYQLERRWARHDDCQKIVWIMLNPSKADADIDDPTIRRCIRFSQAWGYGGLIVVNLFAFRATNPDALLKAADPVGEDNDQSIIGAITGWQHGAGARTVVAAWGAHPSAAARAAHVAKFASTDLLCLGTTQDGHPRHPLYVPAIQPLVPYEVPA